MDKVNPALDFFPKDIYQNQYIGTYKSAYTKGYALILVLTNY